MVSLASFERVSAFAPPVLAEDALSDAFKIASNPPSINHFLF